MKKIFIPLGFLMLALAGYIAAGPFIAIHYIKSGIEQKDAEQLSEYVDFPVLRSNLKEQVYALLMQKSVAGLKDNPWEALAMGFASKLIDGMVDIIVTPSSLAKLMEGIQPDSSPLNDAERGTFPVSRPQLFKNANFTYDRTDKFSAWIKGEHGEKIRFVFTRNGLSWKLSNIIIPTLAGLPVRDTGKQERKAIQEQQPGNGQTVSLISGRAFQGFEHCQMSPELSGMAARFIATGKPGMKKDDAWTYAVKSEVLDMPVKAVMIGVCDNTGARDCGWGSYFAVVIERPFHETKSYLEKKTGIDFTTEKRDPETQITLRPVLRAGNENHDSILFCDPGNL